MLNFVNYLCGTLDEDNTLSGTPLALQAEGFLLSSLLTLAPHSYSAAMQTNSRRSLLPRSVRRAQEFLHSRVNDPVSLADVCQHLGMSARALQLAFRQHSSDSPMAYLRNIRLDRIHDRLKHAKPDESVSISQLAAEYGFLHLGHFAERYHARFGELPTQTRKAKDMRRHG